MKTKRRNHSPAFKAKVALNAAKGEAYSRMATAELASPCAQVRMMRAR